MELSENLKDQFAKMVNNKSDSNSNSDDVIYGTVKVYSDGTKAVILDGSNIATPFETVTDAENDDRVTVRVKNHKAVITGNLSSPAARTDAVKANSDKIGEFNTVLAGKVDTDELDAQIGRINTLVSDNAIIKQKLSASEGEFNDIKTKQLEVEEKVTAAEADIKSIKTDKIDASIVESQYTKTKDFEALRGTVGTLSGDFSIFKNTTTDKLNATDAEIEKIDTDKLDAKTAKITYSTIEEEKVIKSDIEQLNAKYEKVGILDGDVSSIKTLMFGSATGGSITTDFANSVVSMIGIAQIKDSMIDSLDAKKIKALDIDTTDVKVHSKDGKSQWTDNTIQISDSDRLRVQIGKDASGDYNMYVWDKIGNLMFDALGLTEQGVQREIIRNDMIKEDANIAASKLDIESLFNVINNDGTHTLKSNKIYLDDAEQTLNVLLQNITTSSGKDYSEWGSLLKQSDDFITRKLWWTENIDGASVKEKFSDVNQTLQEYSVNLSNMAKYDDEIYLISYEPTKDNYPAWNWSVPVYPSDTQFPREETWKYNDGEWDKYIGKVAYWESEGRAWRFIRNEDGSHGWKEIPNSEMTYMLQQNTALKVNLNNISSSLSTTQQDLKNNYSTTTQINNAIIQAIDAESNSIKSELSNAYVTKEQLSESFDSFDESIGKIEEGMSEYTKTEKLDNYIKQLITDDTTETSIVLKGEYTTQDSLGNTLKSYAAKTSLDLYIKKDPMSGELKSAIEAIADDITLNAKGKISISGNKTVEINGDKFALSSTNTTITADGHITCKNMDASGTFKTNTRKSINEDVIGVYCGSDGIDLCCAGEDEISEGQTDYVHFRVTTTNLSIILNNITVFSVPYTYRTHGVSIGRHVEIPTLVVDKLIYGTSDSWK